jgi:uncharacterized protein Usg
MGYFAVKSLITAEILYHFPDYPKLLQTYIWQEYDLVPYYPALNNFLTFWERELDGKLHSVKVASLPIAPWCNNISYPSV